MPESSAIELNDVTKTYQLFGSQRDQIVHVLGLTRLGLKTRTPAKEFKALSNLSLDILKGQRVGIVGRNGAGKTTLLKLLCGNIKPTHGQIKVNGRIQALMSTGLGFHPEFTGRENAEASLMYNGLVSDEYASALEGIIEFCELGDFLDQPFKTYSLGMQARLMFACATAIKPDILIVDEVLGAGDAYFVTKSKQRVANLVQFGCTMLLVSHSMSQILELCDEVVWLEGGQVHMVGAAFTVVKAYEEFMYGRTIQAMARKPSSSSLLVGDDLLGKVRLGASTSLEPTYSRFVLEEGLNLQAPFFLPHSTGWEIQGMSSAIGMNFIAKGGISRWDSVDEGVKICGFSIVTEQGITNKLRSMKPAVFIFDLISNVNANLSCRYGLAIVDLMGRNVAVIYSPADTFQATVDQTRRVQIALNPVQIGPGEYTLSLNVLDAQPLETINSAIRYDLLSRSFEFSVLLPDTLAPLEAQIMHSAEWNFFSSLNSKS